MNPILPALIVSIVSASTVVAAQTAPATQEERGKATAYANPGAQATSEQKAKAGMATVDKSKKDPKAAQPNMGDPKTMKAQQALSTSGTNPEQAKANVDASSKVARQKPKNVKDMTPEERAAWRKQAEQSKP